MFRKKRSINFLLLILFFSFVVFNNKYLFARSLNDDELLTVKNNGIVSAMCYVNDLLTGKVARAVMALSVLGVGWLFLLGGASWVTVLLFTVASSLIFGGVELANLISGNTYSCKTFEDAKKKYDDIVYNKGVCGIHEINEYYRAGQTWKKCSANTEINGSNVNSSCYEDINNDTEILKDDRVILFKCQYGYLSKDKSKYLNYICKLDNENIGYFFPKKGVDDKGDTNDYKNAACLKACKLSDLKVVYDLYNLKQITDSNGNAQIIANDEGYIGYLENGYYSQGTRLNVTCGDGYMANMRDDEGNCLKKVDFNFFCGEDGIFEFKNQKACQKGCVVSNIEDKFNVIEWTGKSLDKCRSEDAKKGTYVVGDILNAKTCKDGYAFEYNKNGSDIEVKCLSNGSWDTNGNRCYKLCRKEDLQNLIPGNKLLGCKNSNDSSCNTDISKRDTFQYNESVSVNGTCDSGYSISGDKNSSLVVYTCGTNGNWTESKKGKVCKKSCKISDKNNELNGRDYTTVWYVVEGDLKGKDLKGENLDSTVIPNGVSIKAKECKTGYNVYFDEAAQFKCDDGRFVYADGDSNEYCKIGCKFDDLKNVKYDDADYKAPLSTKTWILCSENGVEKDGFSYGTLKEVNMLSKDTGKFARAGAFYKIKECNKGYEIAIRSSSDLVIKCNNEGKWILSNEYSWNFCRIKPVCYEIDHSLENTLNIIIGENTITELTVKMQIWGAPGGNLGGLDGKDIKDNIGGYSYGEIKLKGGESLYVNVGSKGALSSAKTLPYNGGGHSAYLENKKSSTGGGATDIRYKGTKLENRILVAGGGGGSVRIEDKDYFGHKGGGIFKSVTSVVDSGYGIDGSSSFTDQSESLNAIYNSFVTTGVSGMGGYSFILSYELKDGKEVVSFSAGGGGGGGYYGGSGGAPYGGGGGSGYVKESDVQNGSTTSVDDGPTEGGFARLCFGDWFRQTNPCSSSHTDKNSYSHNAGITNNRKESVCKTEDPEKIKKIDVDNIDLKKCSRESLKEILRIKHANLPDNLKSEANILAEYYYEGMTVRNKCESGYNIIDGDDQGRMTFICSGDDVWTTKGTCILNPGCYEFISTGKGKKVDFNAIHKDINEVQIQLWGAPGGSTTDRQIQNYGGYSEGTLTMKDDKVIYVVVGGKGADGCKAGGATCQPSQGGFNGGGNGNFRWSPSANYGGGGGGGGATDIRYGGINLDKRILVAGGAGGSIYVVGNRIGGSGGGLEGSEAKNNSTGADDYIGLGGNQKNGGLVTIDANHLTGTNLITNGVLGQGGFGDLHWTKDNGLHQGAGGGGGYYGGSGGANAAGGGGSGYVNSNIIQNGTTTVVTSGPTDGGFARVCWGDWKNQTNPCTIKHDNVKSYENNAGISNNTTKCTVIDSANTGDLSDINPGTLEKCTRESLLSTFNTEHVKVPNKANENLPANYYNGMIVRGDCDSGYTMVSGSKYQYKKIEFTCQADGTWKVDGRCAIICAGKPNSIKGSYFGDGDINGIGDFYIDGNKVNLNKSNIDNKNFVAVSGSIVDAGCESGYTEINTGGTADNIGGKGSTWKHYYYCDNGTWKHSGKCIVSPGCHEFTSTGHAKVFDVSKVNDNLVDEVQIQIWGAPGGNTSGKQAQNYGGYSKGTLKLTNNNKIVYITVGGKGGDGHAVNANEKGGVGGFNGGGKGGGRHTGGSSYGGGGGGGGATDIRYGGLALTNRIIVAGGAGGSLYARNSQRIGGNGGAVNGSNAIGGSTGSDDYVGLGGSQSAGGSIVVSANSLTATNMLTNGVLGQGGFGDLHWTSDNNFHSGAGGGGGYYGGSGGANAAGGGGSGYVNSNIIQNGTTTVVTSGPTSGGFARVCWGDWTGQTNPCSVEYTDVNSYKENAGITNNATKCKLNSTELTDAVPETLNKCSRTSLLTAFTNTHIKQPINANKNLPEDYYAGMKVRGECDSGYTIISGSKHEYKKVEFTCKEDGTWSVDGRCIVTPGCYEFTSTGNAKKLDISKVNNSADRVRMQLWGAPGGGSNGGHGGYSKGTLKFTSSNKIIYVAVGGKGNGIKGGFNGGGDAGVGTKLRGNGGGGATDVRYGGLALTNRIIVAGGGGGGAANGTPGVGGGLEGGNSSNFGVSGGSQNKGGVISSDYKTNVFSTIGVLGQGGYGSGFFSNLSFSSGFFSIIGAGSGGGGGYYGGGGGDGSGIERVYSAGGGSGYVDTNELIDTPQTALTSTVSPTDGGFARVCWGDWEGQTDPCDVLYTDNGVLENTANLTNNKTKCTRNPDLENVTLGTLPKCSRESLLKIFETSFVTKPSNSNELPENYYAGMTVRSGCDSGYTAISSNAYEHGRVEFTCQEDGTWKADGKCTIACKGKPESLTNYVICDRKLNNCGAFSEGVFYVNGNVISAPNGDHYNNSTFFAEHGSVLDVGCASGYTETKDGGTCHNCGGKSSSWSHYYYCDNGTWKYSGGCLKHCTVPSNEANSAWNSAAGSQVAHGITITKSCSSGFAGSGSRTATCNNGSWSYSGNMECVKGGCRGKPSLITGSYFLYDNNPGNFYLNGNRITTNSSNINDSNFIAENGAMIDAACINNYTEIRDGGTCNNCGGKSSSWGHYYYCDNGTWKYNGTCVKNCIVPSDESNSVWSSTAGSQVAHGTTITKSCHPHYSNSGAAKTATCNNGNWSYSNSGTSCLKDCIGILFSVMFSSGFREDSCGKQHGIMCSIVGNVFLKHGESKFYSCNESGNAKALFCNRWYFRASGECTVSCNNGSLVKDCKQTTMCVTGGGSMCEEGTSTYGDKMDPKSCTFNDKILCLDPDS